MLVVLSLLRDLCSSEPREMMETRPVRLSWCLVSTLLNLVLKLCLNWNSLDIFNVIVPMLEPLNEAIELLESEVSSFPIVILFSMFSISSSAYLPGFRCSTNPSPLALSISPTLHVAWPTLRLTLSTPLSCTMTSTCFSASSLIAIWDCRGYCLRVKKSCPTVM